MGLLEGKKGPDAEALLRVNSPTASCDPVQFPVALRVPAPDAPGGDWGGLGVGVGVLGGNEPPNLS